MGTVAVRALAGLILAFLVMPLLLLIPMSLSASNYLVFPPPGWSLQWYRALLDSERWRDSAFESVRIATATMILSTALGTMAAFPLTRRAFRGKRTLIVLIASPLIVPEIAIALGLYVVALPAGLIDKWWMIAAGQGVLTIPFATIIVSAALSRFDTSIEDAAASLGARPWRVLLEVTLPAILPAVVVSMAFTFIFSLNDLLIPLFLGSVHVVPLPVRIWGDLRTRLDLTTLAISVLWFVGAFVALSLVQVVQGLKARVRRASIRGSVATHLGPGYRVDDRSR